MKKTLLSVLVVIFLSSSYSYSLKRAHSFSKEQKTSERKTKARILLKIRRNLLSAISESNLQDVVKTLLQARHNGLNIKEIINKKDAFGATPLHYAAGCITKFGAKGHLKIVNRLLLEGADPNAQDNDGATPLHWNIDTFHKRYNLYIIDSLRTHGANLDIANNADITFFDLIKIIESF